MTSGVRGGVQLTASDAGSRGTTIGWAVARVVGMRVAMSAAAATKTAQASSARP